LPTVPSASTPGSPPRPHNPPAPRFPPLRQPPPAAPTVVDRINARYNHWVPGSTRLDEIGVIVHGIDATEDPDMPWAVCRPDSSDCGFLSDRMSASVIWRTKGTAAFGGGGGVILNPNATRLLCIYGGDGGTRGKTCSIESELQTGVSPGWTPSHAPGCTPGCVASSYDAWCDGESAHDSWCDGKAWHMSDVGRFLELDGGTTKYNEAIIDGFYWNEHLPWSIEAIIGSPGDPQAVRLHQRFLSTYHISREDVPLVTFHTDQPDCPFRPFDAPADIDPSARLEYKVNGVYVEYTAPAPPLGTARVQRDACYFGGAQDAEPPPAFQPVEDWWDELPAKVVGFG